MSRLLLQQTFGALRIIMVLMVLTLLAYLPFAWVLSQAANVSVA